MAALPVFEAVIRFCLMFAPTQGELEWGTLHEAWGAP